ncbi:hypothetical protein IRJ14_13625 [Isoptericola sp. QY 916]|nr:hypothetical protein [Isoptericola sp. QY 916]
MSFSVRYDPSGPAYHLIGFDTELLTPIFVASRGWTAHVQEPLASNALIRPLSAYDGVPEPTSTATCPTTPRSRPRPGRWCRRGGGTAPGVEQVFESGLSCSRGGKQATRRGRRVVGCGRPGAAARRGGGRARAVARRRARHAPRARDPRAGLDHVAPVRRAARRRRGDRLDRRAGACALHRLPWSGGLRLAVGGRGHPAVGGIAQEPSRGCRAGRPRPSLGLATRGGRRHVRVVEGSTS